MVFRTEIEPIRGVAPISHGDGIVMLGSCFTTNIGSVLEHDGFDVTVNPMGALYNPASIASTVDRALSGIEYTAADMYGDSGLYHCLDFPNSYQSADCDELVARVNGEMAELRRRLADARLWIVTFGTARIFRTVADGKVVGNCHKLPASVFRRELMTVDGIVDTWIPLVRDRRVIFTVSPIRHVADGLHGNQVSKATLLLAVERLCSEAGAEYFPAYEILMDDLRDYRFYAPDMKHPSDVAVDYIYDKFAETYFTPDTRRVAQEHRKEYLRSLHRPNL